MADRLSHPSHPPHKTPASIISAFKGLSRPACLPLPPTNTHTHTHTHTHEGVRVHTCTHTHEGVRAHAHVRIHTHRSKGTCSFFLLPLPQLHESQKALPEFLIWPLFNFYWYKSLRTQVSNSNKYSRNAQDIKERLNKCRYIHVSGQGDTILKAQLKSINSGSRLPLTQPLCSRQVT